MMQRWIGVGVAGIVLLVLGTLTWIYVASETHLRSFARPAGFAFPVPVDAAAIGRGEHLVRTRGCSGCHGQDLGGQRMWGFAVAPNLAAYARRESPATFEAALRHGIGRDGRALYSIPSYNFIRMRDADVADVIAFLRTVPVPETRLPRASLPWRVRFEIAVGRDAAIPQFLDRVPPLRRADDPDPAIARGEYLAMTTCNECHGFGLRADSPWEEDSAPDLVVAMAYDADAFRRLMRTGIAIGDRELEMMSPVARSRFSDFSDAEIDDLYAFLRDMGRRAGGLPPDGADSQAP